MTISGNRGRMRRLSRNERGLSEIVGTLMLVIIVVSAATLLAAFVATYQKQVQTEEAFNHDQSLESLHIINLNTTVKNGTYRTFGFTVASAYVNPSIVLDISINNQPLRFFNWTDLMNDSRGSFRVGGNLNISPDEQVYVALDLNNATPGFSFFGNGSVPVPNTYLKFDVFTYLQNDFQRVFLPPTALAIASEINPSGNNSIILFDGSTSFQGGTNTTIVQWSWLATDANLTTPTHSNKGIVGPILGEEVELNPSSFNVGDTYWVTLTVTNSAGLEGTTSILYTIP